MGGQILYLGFLKKGKRTEVQILYPGIGARNEKRGVGLREKGCGKKGVDRIPCWGNSPDFVSRFLHAQRVRRVQGGEIGFRHNRRKTDLGISA